MNLLFWSRCTRPYSRVCEGEAFSLELFIFHVNEEKVKAMVFPVVMYGCKSWTVKKAEWWRIDTFGKDSDAGRDWGQEEKGMTEDEMVEWHHQLNGHEFEQAPGDGEWQGSLECYSPWCGKELDTTEQLNKEQ